MSFEPSPRDPDTIVSTDDGDRALLEALGLLTIDGALALEPLRATPYKAIARASALGRTVYVKRYDFDRRVVFVKALLKGNFPVFSGPRELENVIALRAAGIPAARPLAAGERTEGARRRSFVVLEALPGVPLENVSPPGRSRERRELVRAVARLVRDLHRAGFWHKDLYLANVIVDGAKLGLVDCERVKRREGGPPRRARARDLGSLDSSAAKWSATDRVRFLKEYLGSARLGSEGKALAREARRRARAILSRGKKG
jgi:tRNA A-37 threonylcarbamoyl transferase component Bud32